MPGWNGFDVLKQLKAQGSKIPQVVFVTAYDQYAIKAFEVRALDYLLKPVDEDRLKATLERIKVALGGSRSKSAARPTSSNKSFWNWSQN